MHSETITDLLAIVNAIYIFSELLIPLTQIPRVFLSF